MRDLINDGKSVFAQFKTKIREDVVNDQYRDVIYNLLLRRLKHDDLGIEWSFVFEPQSGSWSWTDKQGYGNDGPVTNIYATPFWDGHEGIPVMIVVDGKPIDESGISNKYDIDFIELEGDERLDTELLAKELSKLVNNVIRDIETGKIKTTAI